MSSTGPKKAKAIKHDATFVELSTWGTHADGGNGMTHYLDAQLLGGNVGHAALQITFPADKAGEDLIHQYCRKNGETVIPFERTTLQVMGADNKATTQEVFTVNFSWWPSEEKGYRLNANLNEDSALEREGVNMGPRAARFTDPNDPNALDPAEQRIGRGWVGSVNNHLASTRVTMDTSSLSPEQKQLLQAEEKNEQLINKIDTLNVILKKLPENENSVPAAGTLLKLLNKHAPNWKVLIGLDNDAPQPKSFSQENMTILRAAIKTEMSNVNTEKRANQLNINAIAAGFEMEEQQTLAEGADLLGQVLANFTPQEQQKMLKERVGFSPHIWNTYELGKVQDGLQALQPLITFAGENHDLAEDTPEGKESKENVLNALFDGKLATHLEAESALQKVNSHLASIDKLLGNKLIELELKSDPEAKKPIQAKIDTLTAKKLYLEKQRDSIGADIQKADDRVQVIQAKFRELLPPEHRKVTRQTMTPEIFNAVKAKALAKRAELKPREMELKNEAPVLRVTDPFRAGGYERFVTQGLAPDNTIILPVSGIQTDQSPQAKENARKGLNVENMLGKMRELIDDGVKFDLNTKNCSATTGEILAAGAGPELKSYMQQKAWGGFGNPQEVLNGAQQYQSTIISHNGKKPLGERLAAYNPLNAVSYVGGKILSNLVDPKVPVVTKIALGAALIPVAVAAAAVETAKAAVNPLNTFKKCAKFINYARESNSVLLKVAIAPVALVAAAAAPFAGIQFAAKKAIIDPIKNAISAKRSAEIIKNDPMKPKASDEAVQKPKTNIVNITGDNAQTLIQQMNSVLNSDPIAIPEISPSARQVLNSTMSTSTRSDFNEVMKKVHNRTYEQPLPPVPAAAANNGALPAVTAPVSNKKTHYEAYEARILQAQAKFPNSDIKLDSPQEFRKHPHLLRNYARELEKDVTGNKDQPTNFAEFKAKHEKAKARVKESKVPEPLMPVNPLLSAFGQHTTHAKQQAHENGKPAANEQQKANAGSTLQAFQQSQSEVRSQSVARSGGQDVKPTENTAEQKSPRTPRG